MKRTMRRVSVALAVGLFLSAGSSMALGQAGADPLDGAIAAYQQKLTEARTARTLNAETQAQMMAEFYEGLDVGSLTGMQIQKLVNAQLVTQASGRVGDIMARLDTLAGARSEDGAIAACVRALTLVMQPPAARGGSERVAQVFEAAFAHPAIGDALHTGNATSLTRALAMARDPEAMKACGSELAAFALGMDREVSYKVLMGINSIMDGVRGGGLDAGKVESVRSHLVTLAAGALDRFAADPAFMTEAEAKRLRRQHDLLDGAWGRGQLIGYEAPALSFDWTSNDQISSLADLRGNVVVVDFWATWCGPCRSSFPNVAELVTHYEGYPVRVLGVTSLQGYHIGSDAENRARVDCTGDPQKEYGLMPQFMKDMGMTWDVVFTPSDVFNPHYGVNGIPHVAIIAPDGTVRHNGLHPASGGLDSKTKLIDEILAEFNLPRPAPPQPRGERPGQGG